MDNLTPTLTTLRAHEAHCRTQAIEQGGDWRRRFLEARAARELLEREEALGFFLNRTWDLSGSDLAAMQEVRDRREFEEEGVAL